MLDIPAATAALERAFERSSAALDRCQTGGLREAERVRA